jgi:hypothetical protein
MPANGITTGGGSVCCDTTNTWVFVYTSATSIGSMTPSWRVQCAGFQCADYPGGWVAQVETFITTAVNQITGAPYNLLYAGYEVGQTFDANSQGDELTNLYVTMSRSPLMGQVYSEYYGGQRAAGVNGPMANFTDYSATAFHGFAWGLLEDSQQTSLPKYDAVLNHIRRTPCWWANCRH